MARCCSGPSIFEAVQLAEAAAAEAEAAAVAAQAGGLSGTGSPEGVVTANVGALYVDTVATGGQVLWQKISGSGNTGWANAPALLRTLSAPKHRENRMLDPQAKTTGVSGSATQYPFTRITTGLPAGLSFGLQSVRTGTLSATISNLYVGTNSSSSPLRALVTPGEIVSAFINVWTDQSGAQARCNIAFYDSTGTFLSLATSAYTPIAASTWETRAHNNATVPANATHAIVGMAVTTISNANTVAGAVGRTTGGMLVSGDVTIPNYKDGTFADWVWDGLPHESASRQPIPTVADMALKANAAEAVPKESPEVVPSSGRHREVRAWLKTTAVASTGAVQIAFPLTSASVDVIFRTTIRLSSYVSPNNSWTTLHVSIRRLNTGTLSNARATVEHTGAAGAAAGVWEYPNLQWILSTDGLTLYLIIGGTGDSITATDNVEVVDFQVAYGGTFVGVPTLSVITSLPAGTAASVATVDARGVFRGTGYPESVVAAPVGSKYIDTAATNGAVEWLKTSGTGTTGWRVVYGDTGWRDVSASSTSAEVTSLMIRRTNTTAHVKAFFNRTTTGAVAFYAVPAGFQLAPSAFDGRWQTPSNTGGGYVFTTVGGTNLSHTTTVVNNYGNNTFSYPIYTTAAQQAWPATLPGVPFP